MGRLRILFICYWSIDNHLTKATVLPWMEMMQLDGNVEKVILCTIEREKAIATTANTTAIPSKVAHVPLYPVRTKFTLTTKISDFIIFPKEIAALGHEEMVTTLFAHGAPSGALAYKVWTILKLPFYVSLFEPHAEYMAESGVWQRNGLKYIFQTYWERKQKKHATGLFPVTKNYKQQLISEGVDSAKIKTVTCTVDANKFRFDYSNRVDIRSKIGWQNAIVGVYVGKYGGLYFYCKAFQIYKKCFELISDFRLIILSPQPAEEIYTLLRQQNIDFDKIIVKSVPNQEVPAYLSASDFAFATYKPGKSKKYLSPVKIGEYWANGLPVLLTEGVGDDSDIIKKEGGGATFNLAQKGSVEKAVAQILEIIQKPRHRQEIPRLAQKYRSPERLREAFEYFFGEPGKEANA